MEILRGPAGRAILHAATTILLSACFVFLAHGQTSQQVTYSIGQTTSTLTVATPAIALNPLRPAQYFFAYGNPRTYAFGDFNGDGLADIAIAPSYYDKLPERPIEFWINQGDGLFRDGTSEVLRGAKVLTGNVNAVFVADFNEDGRPDVFLLDTGMEVNQPFFPGHRLGLLISQPDGSLIDASDRLSPNAVEYNHAGAVADMNGDGHLDLVVTRMGGRLEADGTLMFAGDGKGNFTATAAGFSTRLHICHGRVSISRRTARIRVAAPPPILTEMDAPTSLQVRTATPTPPLASADSIPSTAAGRHLYRA